MVDERQEPKDIIQQAEKTAGEEIPEDIAKHGIFRRCSLWPEIWEDNAFGLVDLRQAIDRAQGTTETVFAFLRYHDYARPLRSSGFLDYSSRQNDAHQPLYVYWRAYRSGVIFQQSQQPDVAHDVLSTSLTARYVASAVDFAGRMYQSLGTDGPIRVGISIVAPDGTRVQTRSGASGRVPPYNPEFTGRYLVTQLIDDARDIAESGSIELLSQCGLLDNAINDEVRAAITRELAQIRQRREMYAGAGADF